MASHISHVGVHDHGFNNISTYGNLLRLMREGRLAANDWERNFYELALKLSGAVQAARWTQLASELGYIYSFNGPHSLFCDTIRSLRSLAVSHQLGHFLMGEQDVITSLLRRLLQHADNHSRWNVSILAGDATRMTCADAWRTKPFLISRMEVIAAQARSRAILRSPLGRAARPGFFSDTPSNWNSSPGCQ